MLKMTRKAGEKIIINDNIEVTVIGVSGNQVRLGVHAPQEIPVHREEVFDRIQRGKKAGKGK